jgi:prepilin signal peptidase PulO-like enzyme (type II secretory pathway)
LVLVAAQHTQFSLFTYTPIIAARFLIDAVALSTLVVISAYDLRHKIIPDVLSLLFAFVGIAAVALRAYEGIWPSMMPLFVSVPRWIDVAAAPLLAIPLAAIWYFSKGKAMGLGDAKLLWGVAWFLGLLGGLSALIYSFWIAAIPSVIILMMKKGSMRTEVPFGPFIALATVLVYYFGWSVLTLSLSFY